jgi:hypothetical protein
MSEGPIPLVLARDALGIVEVLGEPHWLDQNLYRPMSDRPFEGEDGRDVIDQAIDWWEQQLALVEGAASN